MFLQNALNDIKCGARIARDNIWVIVKISLTSLIFISVASGLFGYVARIAPLVAGNTLIANLFAILISFSIFWLRFALIAVGIATCHNRVASFMTGSRYLLWALPIFILEHSIYLLALQPAFPMYPTSINSALLWVLWLIVSYCLGVFFTMSLCVMLDKKQTNAFVCMQRALSITLKDRSFIWRSLIFSGLMALMHIPYYLFINVNGAYIITPCAAVYGIALYIGSMAVILIAILATVCAYKRLAD